MEDAIMNREEMISKLSGIIACAAIITYTYDIVFRMRIGLCQRLRIPSK